MTTKQPHSTIIIHDHHHHNCHHRNLSSLLSNVNHNNIKKADMMMKSNAMMKSFKVVLVSTAAAIASSSQIMLPLTTSPFQLRRLTTTMTRSVIRPSLSSVLGLATITTRSLVAVNGERYIHTAPSSTADIFDRIQHVIESISSQQVQQQHVKTDEEANLLENLIISICNEYVVQLEPMDEDFTSSTCKRRQIIHYLANTQQIHQDKQQKQQPQHQQSISTFFEYLQQSILDSCSSTSNDDDIHQSQTQPPNNHVLTFLVHLRYDIQQILKQMKKKQSTKSTTNVEENNALLVLQNDSLQQLSERITDIIREQMTTKSGDDPSSSSNNLLLHVHQITVRQPSSQEHPLDTSSSQATTTTPFDVLHRLVSTDYVHPISSVKQLLRTRIFDPPLLLPESQRQNEEEHDLILLKRRVFCLVHQNMPLLLQEYGDESSDDDDSSSLVEEKDDYRNHHHHYDDDVDESLLLEPLVVVHSALTTAQDIKHHGTAGDGAAIPSQMSQLFPKKTKYESDASNEPEEQQRHPTVATFYSISNTQPGLSGFGLGRILLERAIQVRESSCLSPSWMFDTFVSATFFLRRLPDAANRIPHVGYVRYVITLTNFSNMARKYNCGRTTTAPAFGGFRSLS